MNTGSFRVLDIKHGTIVDGVGLRTSIYFAGCKHRCPECHNPQSWDMDGGREMTMYDIIKELEKERCKAVTLTGGDPLFQDLDDLGHLIFWMRMSGVEDIWLYTGYLFENLWHNPDYEYILSLVNVIVDGPFIAKERTTQLPFRGSTNQRLIDVQAILQNESITEYTLSL